jgi:hypothetical protein
MSTRVGNWIIVLGAVGMVVGLICMPAGFGKQGDVTALSLGACLFSMGALLVAAGMYFKSKAIAVASGQTTRSPQRTRGGCDICRGDVPIIDCKVHRVHLCAACLGDHYDFRTCAYVPSTRRAAPKAKSSAKALGM